ncbi:MAG: hypothetical protein F4Z25_05555 [Chloroflexi bacterium]|nr:hypothetical protein [Chloroflexota bacterium]
MAKMQGTKLRMLAADILEYGLDPSELTIVARLEDDDERFVVLDGNRRLTAIKVLENPEVVEGAVSPSVLRAMRRLSRQYHEDPIENVSCVVMRDKDEARHWLELRHTGERGGAGPVLWGSQESARFRARTGNVEPHIQALDFLESRGDLSPERRSQIPATTFRRLLGTPYVRERLGVEVADGMLRGRGDEDAVAKALLHVVNDVADGTIRVGDVYTVEQRTDYADKLPEKVVVQLTKEPGAGVPLGEGGGTQTSQPRRRRKQVARNRERLIPSDCVLNVTEPRLRDIELELRHLKLESHPNAVSVLLRVFLELSVDWYISDAGLGISEKARLGAKLKAVADDLVRRKKLTRKQAQPARRAAQKNTFLGPSVTQMNEWIHNQHMFPGPSDLRSEWDGLQPCFVAVWSAR